MTFSPRRFALIALFSVAFAFANAGVANALVLNWDSAAWAPGDSAGAPRYQANGIADILFTRVPEINPAVTAAGSCLVAFALTVVARRRARIRASRLNSAQS